MKKIKLRDYPYLRGYKSLEIDEKNLEFKNGIAVAKAYGKMMNSFFEYEHCECMGLINENFEEVIEKTDKYSKNLMFLPYNEEIMRCNDDFIVKVNCANEGSSWTEYRHIRLINGVPKFIKQLNSLSIQKTAKEHIIISGSQFYDTELGEYITHPFYEISPIQGLEEEYCITDKLCTTEKTKIPFADFWTFQMDLDLKINSYVISSRKEPVLLENLTYEEYMRYRKERIAELDEEAGRYEENVLSLKRIK